MLKPGDEVMVLPSGLTTTIAAIETMDGPVEEAFSPMSVTVRLTDDLDVSRGDMICRPNNAPTVAQDIDAMVCWMTDEPLRPGQKLAIKHTTRTAAGGGEGPAVPARRQHAAPRRARRRSWASTRSAGSGCAPPSRCSCDEYRRNRSTGGFMLIDEASNRTVAAGMVNSAS